MRDQLQRTLITAIRELLLAGKTVSISGLGEFHNNHREPEEVERADGSVVLTPPANVITFAYNSDSVTPNDSPLIRQLLGELDLNREKIKSLLKSFGSRIQEQSDKGDVLVHGFGVFSKNGDKLEFQPAQELASRVNMVYEGLKEIELVSPKRESGTKPAADTGPKEVPFSEVDDEDLISVFPSAEKPESKQKTGPEIQTDKNPDPYEEIDHDLYFNPFNRGEESKKQVEKPDKQERFYEEYVRRYDSDNSGTEKKEPEEKSDSAVEPSSVEPEKPDSAGKDSLKPIDEIRKENADFNYGKKEKKPAEKDPLAFDPGDDPFEDPGFETFKVGGKKSGGGDFPIKKKEPTQTELEAKRFFEEREKSIRDEKKSEDDQHLLSFREEQKRKWAGEEHRRQEEAERLKQADTSRSDQEELEIRKKREAEEQRVRELESKRKEEEERLRFEQLQQKRIAEEKRLRELEAERKLLEEEKRKLFEEEQRKKAEEERARLEQIRKEREKQLKKQREEAARIRQEQEAEEKKHKELMEKRRLEKVKAERLAAKRKAEEEEALLGPAQRSSHFDDSILNPVKPGASPTGDKGLGIALSIAAIILFGLMVYLIYSFFPHEEPDFVAMRGGPDTTEVEIDPDTGLPVQFQGQRGSNRDPNNNPTGRNRIDEANMTYDDIMLELHRENMGRLFGLYGEMNENLDPSYGIVLFSSTSRQEADEASAEFDNRDWRTKVISQRRGDNTRVWRVVVGQFSTVEEANREARLLPPQYRNDYLVQQFSFSD